MSTTTSTLTGTSSPSPLVSSTSSITSAQQQPPSIARAYKQASQLYLTRRIRESLDALEPLITPAARGEGEDTNGEVEDDVATSAAPIATGSRGARIKVWSLYISILNEVVEMGAEEGRNSFGTARWKELVAKAREGTVWEDVVKDGYGGIEGDVDADVVANLATLLLSHAPSQKLTQQRLETYLSASSSPALDVSSHMSRPKHTASSSQNGTSTPRDLNSRLKILEIYILHVLPYNDEWEYARDFVNMSEVLDDEKREAFLQALQSLQDQKSLDSKREAELQKQREQQLEDARREEMAKRAQKAEQEEQRKKQQDVAAQTNEHDYGVDRSTLTGSLRNSPRPTAIAAQSTPNGNALAKANGAESSRSAGPPAKKSRVPPPTFYRRASLMLQNLQQSILGLGATLRNNPTAIFRLLAFFIALLMALARQDVRDRIRRVTDSTWHKVRETIGMGVKVS